MIYFNVEFNFIYLKILETNDSSDFCFQDSIICLTIKTCFL
jgi:hypothetical protein